MAAKETIRQQFSQINGLKLDVRRLRGELSPSAAMQLSQEDLLTYIEDARDHGREAQHLVNQDLPPLAMPAAFDDDEITAPEPATPKAAPQPETPRSTGWGISSLFSRFLPAVFSPAPAPVTAPATARETAPATGAVSPPILPPAVVDEIGAALTPTETPSRRAPRRPKPKVNKSKNKRKQGTSTNKENPAQRAIINHAIRNLEPEEKILARVWAKKTVRQLATDTTKLGEKRQRLEQPMKLKDVKEIPARRPWESSGSFGLLPEFWDDSDSDSDAEAPGWYMVDQLANEQPPLKKRKTRSEAKTLDANTSTTSPPTFDTHGNSASLSDFHPRSSTEPSPMFAQWNPTVHHEGGNVFHEFHTQTRTHDSSLQNRADFEKELKRTGHVAGSGSFCVPEGDSDEEDSTISTDLNGTADDDAFATLPWTQQPPPAPTPAHASLPNPFNAPPALDPVEQQRLRAMKHTPAKQSRLREVMVQSPAAVDANVNDIPEVMSLDLGEYGLGDVATNMAVANQFMSLNDGAFAGATVMVSYDESEEVITSDEEL